MALETFCIERNHNVVYNYESAMSDKGHSASLNHTVHAPHKKLHIGPGQRNQLHE